MQHNRRVPYTKVGLEMLAQAMNVTTASIWVDPVTNGFGLRDSVVLERSSTSNSVDLPPCDLEEEFE